MDSKKYTEFGVVKSLGAKDCVSYINFKNTKFGILFIYLYCFLNNFLIITLVY